MELSPRQSLKTHDQRRGYWLVNGRLASLLVNSGGMNLFLAHLLNWMACGLSREMEMPPHGILLNAGCRVVRQPCSVCTPEDVHLCGVSADLQFLRRGHEKLFKAYLGDKKRRLRAGWQWS